MTEYFPILIFIAFALVFACVPIFLGSVIGPHRPDKEKLSPFECGFEPFSDARSKFNVRYYLTAILFVIFDLEVAFLFPWAAIFKDIATSEQIRLFGFLEMMLFISILVVGFAYAWVKGALNWE